MSANILLNDTIVALATAQGLSAIAVIRLSGENAIAITQKVFQGKNLLEQPSHTVHFGLLRDGNKTIDIAVVDAKVNIEVDCHQHVSNPKQVLSDLKRTYFSLQKGFLTLRIPNALIREYLEETADYITAFLLENKNKIRNSFH